MTEASRTTRSARRPAETPPGPARPVAEGPARDRPAPQRAVPLRTLSAAAFALAVLAGVAEAVLSVGVIVGDQGTAGIDPGLAAQLVLRGAIFAGALTCAWLLAQGRRWAWWALLLGLGLLGTASMALPLASDLMGGASLYSALGGDVSAAFPVVRVLHLGLVAAGVVTMLHPDVRTTLSERGRRAR
ncbi:hypothetical protein GCM10027063_16220 [Promicromonospora xylanilytica]